MQTPNEIQPWSYPRSTPRSRAGSQELDADAAGPNPEDLLPTVHEDELPELPDAQVSNVLVYVQQMRRPNAMDQVSNVLVCKEMGRPNVSDGLKRVQTG